MTHEQLVKRGYAYLSKGSRTAGIMACDIVLTEIKSGGGEEPDVIGWHGYHSYNIECKASRSDFLADKRKSHREKGYSMGMRKYYLCPKGLIQPDEVPDDWGLIWAYPKLTKVVKSVESHVDDVIYWMNRELLKAETKEERDKILKSRPDHLTNLYKDLHEAERGLLIQVLSRLQKQLPIPLTDAYKSKKLMAMTDEDIYDPWAKG